MTGDRVHDDGRDPEREPGPNYGRRFRLGPAEACSIAECLKMAAASTVHGRPLPEDDG